MAPDNHADVPRDSLEDYLRRLPGETGGALLDLSIGYGLVARIAAMGYTVASVDTEREILEPARRGSAPHLPHADGAFAGVFCADTLSVLPRGQAAPLLREIQRVLSPGGLAFASFAPIPRRHSGTISLPSRSSVPVVVRLAESYQNREIENLFGGLRIVSFVTHVNGVRRIIAAKRSS